MRLIVTIVLGALMLASCKKVADDILDLFPEMSASVDGNEWNSITRKTSLKDGKFIISGVSTSGETIVLTTFGTATGEYDLSITSIEMAAVYNDTDIDDIDNPTNAYFGLTGTVNLTEVNNSAKTVSGTFSFTAAKLDDIVEVTNGKFEDLKFTED